MQTIASLASRLGLNADEAVETLRKLHFTVEGVDSEISDEQTDILIEVDEDPSALDKYLQKVIKREEDVRKKTERLQDSAKKAAAKKKAAAQAAEEEDEAKKKAAPKIKEVEVAEILPDEVVEEPPAPVVAAAPVEEPAAVEEIATPEVEVPTEEIPVPVEAVVEAAAPDLAPVVEEPVAEHAEKPAEETVPHAEGHAPIAEIMSEEEEALLVHVRKVPPKRAKDDTLDQAEAHHREDLARVKAEAAVRREQGDKPVAPRPERPERPERVNRPLPQPDPDVVAAVIRKAQERSRIKAAGDRRGGPPHRGGAGAPGAPGAENFGGSLRDRLAPAAPAAPGAGADLPGREQSKKKTIGKTAKKKQKRAERARVLEDTLRRDAAQAVREYTSGGAAGMPKKRKHKKTHEDGSFMEDDEMVGGMIEVDDAMTVERLADAMGMGVNDIILELMEDNVLAHKNQVLDISLIRSLAERHNFEVQTVIPEEEEVMAEEPDAPEDLVFRAPVVTVMGHVDHGKTSLLDAVRRANVMAGEAGGITQHIAAYDVETKAGRVVFLDTPGHEAFTQMRARGAKVTDVVVLVVAADDGVKPQTIEAIDHAKAAEVPIVVAINKCDKPDAQPDRVRQELTRFELLDEAWGGKTIMKNISAKMGEGIDELMELLVLESEMLELKANPNKRARGTVVESELTRGQGAVAWVLVQTGTLRVGDVFLAGETYGRVRTMTTSRGEQVQEAGPSMPVAVTGFNIPPNAGDVFVCAADERAARSIAEKRIVLNRNKKGNAVKHMTLEDFHARMAGAEQKVLNVIIKADVQGSMDVLESSLSKLGNMEVSVRVVHSGVGGVNESDVILASASDAVIIGFHVTANSRVQKLAEIEGVDIRTYRIIYEAIEEVHKALEGMLTPDSKEIITGHAEIRQVFRSSSLGNIAGSSQLNGETTRGSKARLLRNDVVVYTGSIATIRREKDDVKMVATGFECGIKLERFDDIQVGDIIECFRVEQVAKTL